jgi:hypothetical protein
MLAIFYQYWLTTLSLLMPMKPFEQPFIIQFQQQLKIWVKQTRPVDHATGQKS